MPPTLRSSVQIPGSIWRRGQARDPASARAPSPEPRVRALLTAALKTHVAGQRAARPSPVRGGIVWPTARALGAVGNRASNTEPASPEAASGFHDHPDRDTRQMSPRWGLTAIACELGVPTAPKRRHGPQDTARFAGFVPLLFACYSSLSSRQHPKIYVAGQRAARGHDLGRTPAATGVLNGLLPNCGRLEFKA
jgi:hypothetical protein